MVVTHNGWNSLGQHNPFPFLETFLGSDGFVDFLFFLFVTKRSFTVDVDGTGLNGPVELLEMREDAVDSF